MSFFQRNSILFSFFALVFVIVFLIFAVTLKGLPTSTDSVRVLLGADELVSSGFLAPNIYENGGYVPYERDVNVLYPQFQIISVLFSGFSSEQLALSVQLVVALLVSLNVVAGFYFLREFFGRRSYLPFIGVFLFGFSLSFGRSYLLTPQNLFGFLFIFLSSIFLLRFLRDTSQKKYLYLLLFFLVAFFHFHHLSFFIFLSLCFVYGFFAIKGVKKFYVLLLFTVLGAAGFSFLYFVLGQQYLLTEFLNAFQNPERANIENARSLLQLPAQIGYVLFSLAIVGFFLKKKSAKSTDMYLYSFLIVVSLLSYLHYVGFYFYPDRFVLYFVFPFVVFALYGLRFLLKRFSVFGRVGFVSLCIVGTFIHFAVFLYDDYSFFVTDFVPTETDFSAYSFLEQKPDGRVLATYRGGDRSSLYIPYFTEKEMVLFDMEQLLEPTYFLEDGDQRVSDVAIMINFPQSEKAQVLFEEYGVQYVYLRKGGEEDFVFQNAGYKPLFIEGNVVIYEI